MTNFPPELRRDLWVIASGARKEMKEFPYYYNDILNEYPDYVPSLFEKNIENDLNRTFPEEEFFQDTDNIDKIRNILIAFSRRNSSIGYTQGFNFIVGRLLQIIGNEVRIINIIIYKYIFIGRNILGFCSNNRNNFTS